MKNNEVFSHQAMALLCRHVQISRIAAWKLPLIVIGFVCCVAAMIGAISFEFQIMEKLFGYLAGEDSEYFKPEVMGFSALIVVLGLHFLALSRPDHPALASLERMVGGLMFIFLLGIGLLLAALLYQEGVDGLFDDAMDVPDWDIEATEGALPFYESLMANITNPLASFAFSLGIGSLAMMSVFVTHKAMYWAQYLAHDAMVRINMLRSDNKAMRRYITAKTAFDEVQLQLHTHYRNDDDSIREALAQDALHAQLDGLAPTQQVLSDSKLLQGDSPFSDKPNFNLKEMEKRYAQQSVTTPEQLMTFMQ